MGFLSDLFGGSGRKDLRAGKAAADKALEEGFNTANTRYDEAYSTYDPYAQRGEQGAQAYYNALLGTPEQKAAAFQSYQSDPAMAGILGQQTNKLLRAYNSQGSGTGGGRLALAGARVGLENYNGYLDRLGGLGNQGLQVAGAQSGVRAGQGDLAMGYGATKAGNSINFANAISQNRTTGANNMLNAAGTAVKAATAIFSDIRLKREIRKLGRLASGLPYYSFKYTNGDTEFIGVMAQETLEYFPEAVGVKDGYLYVDYSRIG